MTSEMIDTHLCDVHIFYPDGEAPESGQLRQRDISSKWLDVCDEIYKQYGPVFKHNMGSSLSHFDLAMAGPTGELIVDNVKCFDISISLGHNGDQDIATTTHFTNKFNEATKILETEISTESMKILKTSCTKPSLLIFDYCRADVSDDNKQAIIQLAYHIAAAYFRFTSP